MHTDVTFANHLPLVLRNDPTPTPSPTATPQPIKQRTGIHLGSRQDEWPDITLHRLNGGPRSGGAGIWPRAVVVLSGNTFTLDRRPAEQDVLCSIAQARWKHESAEYDLVDYLTEANANGVMVIIRIEPSPGNFQDWDESALPHTLLSGTDPAGPSYCWRNDWPEAERQWGFQYFRSIVDLATEIHEIYKLLEREGWAMERVYFEPANEPNKEWFVDWTDDLEAQEKLQTSAAWTEMDLYFSNLYDHLKSLDSNIQILTPPMAQGSFAETLRFTSCAPMTVSVGGESGYAFMPDTFTTKNDGYSWHNYWRKDHETWVEAGDTLCPTSEHIFQYFPSSMQTTISSSEKPAFITEADLFSPCQESDNAVTDKDLQAEETQQSLWQFVSQEQGADYVIAWLLTEYPHSTVVDCHKTPPLLNYPEIKWHEGYNNNVERIWFGPWWSGAE